jgi:glycosyltransferase involved in cell wall biosynthesis
MMVTFRGNDRHKPLTVNLMTVSLKPGDAIGNYVLTSARIWQRWGAHVRIFGEYVDPTLALVAEPARYYQPTGDAILWYHFSIYDEANIGRVLGSHDFKVMDYHGISPPHLFRGQNAYLADLCRRGSELLPQLRTVFDAAVVHSSFTGAELQDHGFDARRLYQLPLCVDTDRFADGADIELVATLAKLDYCLFVGRLVPQKDLLALLDIFDYIHQSRPEMVLVLVGSPDLAQSYQRQIQERIRAHGLERRVLFTGQVNNPVVLAALFQQASLLLVTSEWESFCVPLVEAMYFGTPAVVHDIPPLPEVLGSGGLVVNKRRPEEAAAAILELLDDRQRYTELATAMRQRSAAFTDIALAGSLFDMLNDMVVVSGEQ